jgi:sugar phosphate isomerase/epimerase
LYTLRHFDDPLSGVVERVASAGFEGVEFANRIHDADAAAVADALDDTGLEPVSAHVDLSRLEDSFEETVDRYETVGVHDLIVPHLPVSHFRTESRVDAIAERFLAVERRLAGRGFTLNYHNQVHDFLPLTADATLGRLLTAVHPHAADAPSGGLWGRARTVGGTVGDKVYERLYQGPEEGAGLGGTAFRYFAEATAPDVGLQIDVGSVAAAGFEPRTVLEQFEDRLQSVHLKDIAVESPRPTAPIRSVPAGEGILDVPSVLSAARDVDAEWIVYENDDPPDPQTSLHNGAEALEGSLEVPPENRA